MAKKKEKKRNVKPEIPLDVQQSILGITPEVEEKAKKKEEPEEKAAEAKE